MQTESSQVTIQADSDDRDFSFPSSHALKYHPLPSLSISANLCAPKYLAAK